MDNATITGSFTITPALTTGELQEMSFAHLDLVQHQEHTAVPVDGRADAGGFEKDLKNLVRQVGPARVRGHVQVWGDTPGDLYRLGIVDGRVWAYHPQITWPQD